MSAFAVGSYSSRFCVVRGMRMKLYARDRRGKRSTGAEGIQMVKAAWGKEGMKEGTRRRMRAALEKTRAIGSTGLRRGNVQGEGGGAGAGSCLFVHDNRHDRYSPNNTREGLGLGDLSRQVAVCL
jgi:hypothetical protein